MKQTNSGSHNVIAKIYCAKAARTSRHSLLCKAMFRPRARDDLRRVRFDNFIASLLEEDNHGGSNNSSRKDPKDGCTGSRGSRLSYYADAGHGDELGKGLAVSHARMLLQHSCTLAEKLGDLAAGYLSFDRSISLPVEVRDRISSFLPSPEEELEGRQILGLHNGHDFFFRCMASLPAGRLKCSYDDLSFRKAKICSVADFCAGLGCPVLPSTPVALASRCSDELGRECERLVPLPAEFAVLVPCGASTRDLQALEHEDCSQDVYVLDPDVNWDLECEGDDLSQRRARRKRKRREPSELLVEPQPREAPPLALDRQLHNAAGYADPDHVLGGGPGLLRKYACAGHAPKVVIRNLLRKGANPSIPIGGKTACDKALHARDGLQSQIQDLRAGGLSAEDVLQKYVHSKSFEEAREHARAFLAELATFQESVVLLQAAATVWSSASPATRTFCSRQELHGRGVVRPDPGALQAALAAAEDQAARAPSVLVEDIQALAAAMWKLASDRQTGKRHCKRGTAAEASPHQGFMSEA